MEEDEVMPSSTDNTNNTNNQSLDDHGIKNTDQSLEKPTKKTHMRFRADPDVLLCQSTRLQTSQQPSHATFADFTDELNKFSHEFNSAFSALGCYDH